MRVDFSSHLLDIGNGNGPSYQTIIKPRKELVVRVNNIAELIEKVYLNVKNQQTKTLLTISTTLLWKNVK